MVSEGVRLPGQWSCLILARGVSAVGEDRSLETAILAVDLKTLDAGNQEAFDASLRTAHSALAPIEKIFGKTTFHLTGNSHIEAAWLWQWTETVDVVKRTFGSAAQLMDEYSTYTYTQSFL